MLIKVTAQYRWCDGARFDHHYYATEHMKITREAAQGFGLIRLESERVHLPTAEKSGLVVAATSAWFSSLTSAQDALAAIGPALHADLVNYTNIRPEMRIAEVASHLCP